jgi:FAD/FMN-containing dehydrogenase
VYPGSAKDVQQVVRLAQKHNIPLYAVGGGTVILIGSIPGMPDKGITLDFHRMQKITVDPERLAVRVQPGATGIQVSQHIRQMNFGYRPFFGGSPGMSNFVAYQVFTGQNKLAGFQDGMGINCTAGMEMVLPSGELLRTGSMARPGASPWPHGPGPALTYLPFFSSASYGIVTEMEFRLFPIPLKTASLWMAFDSIGAAVKGIYAVMKLEYSCGISLMGHGCYVHCLYSARHWQEGSHFIKATQNNIALVSLSFRGSLRKVEYERKACIRALKKLGGVPLPPWMVAILDGHETNVTGWQQTNNARSLGTFNGKFDSGGLFVTSGAFDSLDTLEEHMQQGIKDYQAVCKAYPEFINTPSPSFHHFASGIQAYLAMGGHANAAGEFIYIVDYANKELLPLVGELEAKFKFSMHKLGVAPLSLGRDERTRTECLAHYDMAKLIKKAIDPQGFLAPGAAFPVDLSPETNK